MKFMGAAALGALMTLTACDQVRLPGADKEDQVIVTEERLPDTERDTPISIETVDDEKLDSIESTGADIRFYAARTPPEKGVRRAEIDWPSARADFAKREITPESNMVTVASGADAPPVPVLLPDMPVTTASAEGGVTFRPLADGYYAIYPGARYDTIINGTDRLAAATSDTPASDTELRFEQTLTGAQVAFSRYGASYLIEFACKDPETAVKGSCISRNNALQAAEDLLIAGTR